MHYTSVDCTRVLLSLRYLLLLQLTLVRVSRKNRPSLFTARRLCAGILESDEFCTQSHDHQYMHTHSHMTINTCTHDHQYTHTHSHMTINTCTHTHIHSHMTINTHWVFCTHYDRKEPGAVHRKLASQVCTCWN